MKRVPVGVGVNHNQCLTLVCAGVAAGGVLMAGQLRCGDEVEGSNRSVLAGNRLVCASKEDVTCQGGS